MDSLMLPVGKFSGNTRTLVNNCPDLYFMIALESFFIMYVLYVSEGNDKAKHAFFI